MKISYLFELKINKATAAALISISAIDPEHLTISYWYVRPLLFCCLQMCITIAIITGAVKPYKTAV